MDMKLVANYYQEASHENLELEFPRPGFPYNHRQLELGPPFLKGLDFPLCLSPRHSLLPYLDCENHVCLPAWPLHGFSL